MHSKGRHPNVIFGANLRPDSAALAILILLLFLLFVILFMTLTAQPAQAQTYQVLHNFTGGADGAIPVALAMDKTGNLFGTTTGGGYRGACYIDYGCGTAFRLSKKGFGWIFTPLYEFTGNTDGAFPMAGVVIGSDGSLYGTTMLAGGGDCQYQDEPHGCGTVFRLRPPAHASPNALGGWAETTIYAFNGDSDGAYPMAALIFDEAGNLYGTTSSKGASGDGSVYELMPSQGGWTARIIHSFNGGAGSDGGYPTANVIFDNSGNLYGTTAYGGTYGYGTAFQLLPVGGGWTENVLYSFDYYGSDGGMPAGGLILDQSGNLYGTTSQGYQSPTVFMLSPTEGGWQFNVIYYGVGSTASLVMDAAGNLYGTSGSSVFKLTPGRKGWTYTSLHDFTGGSDGFAPNGVILDASGNLYGTAEGGGTGSACNRGCGVVWEITP